MNFEQRGGNAGDSKSPDVPRLPHPTAGISLPHRFPHNLATIGSANCSTTALAIAIGAHPLAMLDQFLQTDALRRRLRHCTRNVATVTPREREMFRELIAEEIRACRSDPLISDDHWTCLP